MKLRLISIIIVLMTSACNTSLSIQPQQMQTQAVPTATRNPEPVITPVPMSLFLDLNVPNEHAIYTQHKNEIIKRIVINEDCFYPCLMGIIPGESNITHLNKLASSLPKGELLSLGEMALESFHKTNPDYHLALIRFGRAVKREESRYVPFGIHFVLHKGTVINTIMRADQENEAFEMFKLKDILSIYGKPERILIDANNTRGRQYQVSLLLFYGTRGFAVEYIYPVKLAGFEGNSERIGCMDDIERVYLVTWDSKQVPHTYEGIQGKVFVYMRSRLGFLSNNTIPDGYIDLNKATSHTLDSLFEIIMRDTPDFCLRTSNSLWK